MITMEEVNQALRETWTQELKKEESLPKQLAKGYKTWVQSMIKGAVERLQGEENPAAAQGADAGGDAGGDAGQAPQE